MHALNISFNFDVQNLLRHALTHLLPGEMGYNKDRFLCNSAGCVDNPFSTKQVQCLFIRQTWLVNTSCMHSTSPLILMCRIYSDTHRRSTLCQVRWATKSERGDVSTEARWYDGKRASLIQLHAAGSALFVKHSFRLLLDANLRI